MLVNVMKHVANVSNFLLVDNPPLFAFSALDPCRDGPSASEQPCFPIRWGS